MAVATELKFDFAAQDPLTHPRVMEALLGYVPQHRDMVIDNHYPLIRRVDQLQPKFRKKLEPLGLEDDYEIALLNYRAGDDQTNVRVWQGLTTGQLRLLDYFNFAYPGQFSWRESEDIARFLRPQSMTPTYAHISHFLPWKGELITLVDLDAEPIMGLDRMVDIAGVTREEFFADPNLSFVF